MSRPKEVAYLIKQEFAPSQIAHQMNISYATVTQYIDRAIAADLIKASDVVFVLTKCITSNREIINKAKTIFEQSKNGYFISQEMVGQLFEEIKEICVEDYDLLIKYKQRRVVTRDMYEYLSNIEISLHHVIKRVLQFRYKDDSEGWWRKIPVSIRKDCDISWEEDLEPATEPYAYTNFIHLREILAKNWPVFCNYLPEDIAGHKDIFLGKFVRLNHIRNGVMHPIKEISLDETDFEFVRTFFEDIQPENWQTHPTDEMLN